MVAWPGSLPQSPLIGGYQRQDGDMALRTAMDVGPAKLRKRATAVPDAVSFSMLMTKSQLTTLETFYENSLNGGTDVVDFTDPITNTTKQYRFLKRYDYRAVGDDLYEVRFDWEQLP